MILETIAIRTVWAKAWDAIKAVPWWVWLALAVAALWWIDRGAQHREGYREGVAEVTAKYETAIAEANRAAEAARKSEEEALVALAKGTDDAVEGGLRDELSRARDFIARNRVPNCPGARRPAAPAPDRSAGDNERTSQTPLLDDTATGVDLLPDADAGFVVVPADDVLICTENTVKAEAWRAWGQSLEARGRE